MPSCLLGQEVLGRMVDKFKNSFLKREDVCNKLSQEYIWPGKQKSPERTGSLSFSGC